MGIFIFRGGLTGYGESYDLSKLEICGVRADILSREELFAKLSALKVPNIDHRMGCQEMLEVWARHLQEVVV